MQRTNVYFDEEQLSTLRHFAAHEGRSVTAVVREAVTLYLAQTLPRVDSLQLLAGMIERIHATIPADVSPEEIEADIDIAVAEVRLRNSLESLKTQEDWDRNWEVITERFRKRVSPYLSPEAIDAEIELARAEVRAAGLRGDRR